MGRIRKSLRDGQAIEWKVALYLRLSKEDGNDESLSVANQRKILTDYLQNSFTEESYSITDSYIDDGLTGTDTNRENFIRMKQDIIGGRVNCVIVKSLARAFRNLADQQKFLEEFLPLYNVRFISLGTPFIDTFINPGAVGGFEVPIRGLFNEQFAAATSEEIRKTFNMKRQRGEFIGAFAPYGYKKQPENKNKLCVDEKPALVVKDIFTWFLYGLGGDITMGNLSISGIARELNARGVLSPTAYKKQTGYNYQNPNSKFPEKLWSPTTVAAILKNRVYTGCMVQGRQRVISYKIHKQVKMPEDAWFIKENTHPPIISAAMFEAVQKRLLRDTRTAPGQNAVHLFSGFLKCGDCGRALHRRSSKGRIYYYCRTYKQTARSCPPRPIREDTLKKITICALQAQISLVEDFVHIIEKINSVPATAAQFRLDTAISRRRQEISRLTALFNSLYEDWKTGDLTRDEYLQMKAHYSGRLQALEAAVEKLEAEHQHLPYEFAAENSYLQDFLGCHNIAVLNHALLMDLIDVISVQKDGSVEIRFTFADQYQSIAKFIENNRQLS